MSGNKEFPKGLLTDFNDTMFYNRATHKEKHF